MCYAVLTWYLEGALPDENGVSGGAFFFLKRSYWGLKEDAAADARRTRAEADDAQLACEDATVVAEARAVRDDAFGDRTVAVKIRCLEKTFTSYWQPLASNSWAGALFYAVVPALAFAWAPLMAVFMFVVVMGVLRTAGCGLKFNFTMNILPALGKNAKVFRAVRGVSLAIDEGELLVLLGHNGAGKSTTINMLTGVLECDGGDATVFGRSIRHEMAQIRQVMGVCPQHDKLFARLTGREHLDLWARLKGVPEERVSGEVAARLDDVLLVASADIFSSSYSGGMQRRLSIALALLGDPKIVFLDEPTTGMDPVTRRQVWDMIMRAKRGRVILLTTHSMEEADILGDRTAIMSKGNLQALGTNIALKQAYGGGFRVSVFALEATAAAVDTWMTENIPGTTRTERGVAEGCLLYQVKEQPTAEQIAALERAKQALGFSEFSVGMATLDDVFLNLSIKDEGAAGVGSLNDDRFNAVAAADAGTTVVSVAIPEGLGKGDTFTIEANGQQIAVAVPEGLAAGQTTLSVQVPAVKTTQPTGADAPAQRSECSVCFFDATPDKACCCDCCRCVPWPADDADDELHSEQFGGEEHVAEQISIDAKTNHRSQVGALAKKTITYQSRQRKSMACIVCCPFIFILAIVLLNTLWLATINDRLVTNTLKKKPKIVEAMKYCDRIRPRAWVGLISDYNFMSNDLPDEAWDESKKWARYTMLEQPSWQFLVSGAPADALGGASVAAGEAASAWHMQLLAKARALGMVWYKQNDYPDPWNWKLSKPNATAYDDAFEDLVAHFASANITSIADTAASGSEDTLSAASGVLSGFSVASVGEPLLAPYLSGFVKGAYDLLPAAALCRAGGTADANCTASSAALAALGVNGTCELGLWDWLDEPVQEGWEYGVNQGCDFVPATASRVDFERDALSYVCDAPASEILAQIAVCDTAAPYTAPYPFFMTCPLWQMVFANTSASTVAAAFDLPQIVAMLAPLADKAAIDAINASLPKMWALSKFDAAGFGGLCAYNKYRDAEVGTTLTPLADEAAINAALYADWGGARAKGTARTTFAAYHFYEADDAASTYNYRTWVNYSGTGSQSDDGVALDQGWDSDGCWEGECEVGKRWCLGGIHWLCNAYPDAYSESWVLNVKLMNAAILKQQAGIELDMDLLSFPGFFDIASAGLFGRTSINDYFAMIFMPYILLMLMFLITGLIVYEKQERLREIMLMSGLKMETYFVVTYGFYLMQYAAMIVVLWVVSVALGDLQTFQIHDFGVLFLFFFLWGNVLVSFSFMLSSLFGDATTAVCFTFMLMMLTVECGGAINYGYVGQSSDLSEERLAPFMVLPSFVAYRGIYWLSAAGAAYQPITWENIDTYAEGVFVNILVALAWQWPTCLILWWYFEKVFAVGMGVAQHPLFFLRPVAKALTGSARLPGELEDADARAAARASRDDLDGDEPPDVVAERARVEADDCADPVRLLGLRKVFASRGGAPPKVALAGLTIGVKPRECLGMLGHNGAGKTTAISMLCGLFAPTGGDARVLGRSIRTAMAAIHGVMGVCPQHDVLWKDLTALEHVSFYARLRQIPPGKAMKAATAKVLADVALSAWANAPSRRFSGGMKRRLSVACALVGNPRIVYLDEPSTGLDPASRRRLWRVITEFKQRASEGSGVVLTTHSMEEAEVLCDRIAIMSEGRLRCIGHGADIKRRFGEAYKLTIHTASHSDAAAEAVRAFVVSQLAADARPLNASMGGTTDFEMPRASITLSEVYAKVEGARAALGIADWAISETTLEEVFLKISHQTYGAIQDKLAPVEAPAGVEIGVELTQKPAPADDGGVAEA